MVSVTLSIPKEIKEKMVRFSEVNWSGFIRKQIIKKAEELSWKDKMMQKLKQEQNIDEWAVDLQTKSRKNRISELRKKGLV